MNQYAARIAKELSLSPSHTAAALDLIDQAIPFRSLRATARKPREVWTMECFARWMNAMPT